MNLLKKNKNQYGLHYPQCYLWKCFKKDLVKYLKNRKFLSKKS